MSLYTQNLSYDTAQVSGLTKSGADKYPNPFCDIASEYIPTDLEQIFEWVEYLMMTMAPFRSISQRIARYFLTEIVISECSDEERQKYEDLFSHKLHMIQKLAEMGDDLLTYGNSFTSIYFPFDRWLTCPKCLMDYHCKVLDFDFDGRTGKFKGVCPKCGNNVEFIRQDRMNRDLSKVKIIRWDPKRIRLRVHPISEEVEYYYKLDNDFVKKVSDGNRFYLDSTPWGMVRACLGENEAGKDGETLFKFNDDQLFHMRAGNLAGVPVKGWGIPPMLPNFKLAYYIQLLRRYDEAIALDFIVPFRILYPQNQALGNQDPLSAMSMQTFINAMSKMVESKRKNITDIQVAPFSVGYELIGGEAKSLSPKDNIAQAQQELRQALGYPQELYDGTLSLQAAPTALRLFEKEWNHLVQGYNDFIAWCVKKISARYMWGSVDAELRPVTLADDIERKGLQLQAAGGMDISKQTAYKPFGIDYIEEQKRIVNEQSEIQKIQQRAMEEAASQQANGVGSGDPQTQSAPGMDPSGGIGATPGDVYEQAHQIAEDLIFRTPQTMVRGQLIKIKQSNPTLHALVKQFMSEIRQGAASQGQAMVIEQQKQQMG